MLPTSQRRTWTACVLSVAVASGAAVACAKVPEMPQAPRAEGSAALDQPFTVRAGETVAVANTPLVITFERVPEDSRCPTNVNCVWAGNAIVRLSIRHAGEARPAIELHTTTPGKREAGVDGFRLQLVQLAPSRTEGTTIAQDQYIATITVVRSA